MGLWGLDMSVFEFGVPGIALISRGKGRCPPWPPGGSRDSPEGRVKFVYDVMTDTYFWYDKVPDIDYSVYTSPEDLLEILMYRKLDRWSYITSKEEFHSYFILKQRNLNLYCISMKIHLYSSIIYSQKIISFK